MDPGQHDDRHVVDIQFGRTAEPTSYCAVCKQPLVSVTAVACSSSTCMVRLGVCGTHCPPVVVKEPHGRHGGGDPIVDQEAGGTAGDHGLPPPASKEGGVGEQWYHGDTALHVHDEQERQEEKKARPRYVLKGRISRMQYEIIIFYHVTHVVSKQNLIEKMAS